MTLRNRVGREMISQSMFGMSAPSVKIAEQFEDIRFAPEMGGNDYEPRFTRTGYFPVLKPSIIDFRSAARVLEYTVGNGMAIELCSGMACHIYDNSLQPCWIRLL